MTGKRDIPPIRPLPEEPLTHISGGTSGIGSEEHDQLVGTGLDEEFDGHRGVDVLLRGGNDTDHGGADGDFIKGEEGGDDLHGQEGRDQLFGGEGDDRLTGGIDDDTLNGGTGGDNAGGGDGNDVYDWRIGDGNDVFKSGAGDNTIKLLSDNQLGLQDLDIRIDGPHAVSTVDGDLVFALPVSRTITYQGQTLTFTDVTRITTPRP